MGVEDVEEQEKKEQKERAKEKAEKKQEGEETETKPVTKSKSQKKIRAHIRGKKYLLAKKAIEVDKKYSLKDALALLKKIKYAAYDESVELHINLIKEGLRGEVKLPHTIGKERKIAVVDDAVLSLIEKGKIDFDILISHPSFMPKLARFAKILGPRGLMPNPKTGTLSPNPEEAAKKFKTGTLQWKAEAKAPLLHQMIAKVSHSEKDIQENISTLVKSIGKPNIQKMFIKTSMSPAVLLDSETV